MYKKRKIIHEVRQNIESGMNLNQSIKEAGLKSIVTFWNWRKKNKRLDNFIELCLKVKDTKRNEAVEDVWTQKLLRGEGSATDYMFYLMNRMPERWQDRRALVNFDQSKHTHYNNVKIYLPEAEKEEKNNASNGVRETEKRFNLETA